MADRQRPSLRFAVALALALVALVEVHTLLQGIRSQRRLRDRVVTDVRERVIAALPRLTAALARSGLDSWNEATGLVLAEGLASEVEVREPGGRLLLSRPTDAPVAHWPSPAELDSLREPGSITSFAQSGPVVRVLTYVAFRNGERPLVLRLAARAPDLEEDVRERQRAVLSHYLALCLLVLAGGLLLLPERTPEERPAANVLDAYEQAMVRLRDRGHEMTREHEAERRRLEDVLHDKEAMARAGELTAGIAHEVRNGLGTIVGYARLVERSAASAESEDAARSILGECATLEAVVRRFMDFVRRETLNLVPFDLRRMLSRVAAREGRGREGRVTVDASDDVGTLVGDEELLERAFENLIRNALEAGGTNGRVDVGARLEAETIVVTVSDDGPGLPEEAREGPRPFLTTKPGGLGLGLPIAIKIVRLHQGELTLADRRPRGVQVTVRLPPEGPRP